MKSIFYYIFSALTNISALSAIADADTALTNDVAIGNRHLCFIIEDHNSTNGSREVSSEKPLSWILHNPTTNYANVHWQKLDWTFSLRLLDNQGHEVSLTDYGKEMNSGPKPFPATASIHLIGLQPGQTAVMDFTSIDKLFKIPNPGEYIFEARYWYIEIGSNGKWKLSDPVRLKVIKRPLGQRMRQADDAIKKDNRENDPNSNTIHIEPPVQKTDGGERTASHP